MRHVIGSLLCVFGFLGVALWPGVAAGATFTAACGGTVGDGSALVGAIDQANAAGGSNVVQLGADCVYTLTAVNNYWYGPNGLPPIASDITIEGNGATIARSQALGTPAFRLLFVGADPSNAHTLGYVSPGAGGLTLRDLTLTGGLARGGSSNAGGGGGAGMGGAIFSQGTVAIVNSTLTANSAVGGASFSGEGSGGGIGSAATGGPSGTFGGGFGPGSFGGGGGGAAGGGGGGGGAGFRFGETGAAATAGAAGAGGGSQTGLGGSGGSGAVGGDGGAGGGASSSGLPGGTGGGFGTGGGVGGFLGSGGGGGGVGGGGGGGQAITGGGGGFGGGGGSASTSQVGSPTVQQAGGNGGFGGGGGGNGNGPGGAPGFGGGTPSGVDGASGAGMGGAIFNMQGTLTIQNSTLTGNSAAGGSSLPAVTDPGKGIAGAVFNLSGTVTAVASTIAGNSADHYASQILNLVYDGAQERHALTTLPDTIVANGSGGTAADVASDKSAYITPAQPAGSTALVDVSQFDLLTTAVATVIAPGELGQSTGSPLLANPRLGPLQDNGGPTQTMALLAGSAAIDLVPTSDCLVTSDQRGVSRPQGPACDAGAYERAPASISGISGTADSAGSATVAASVNPNLRDTTVVVDYGKTTAYGSSTASQDIGAGTIPASFSAELTGLAANTTYHFELVAINGDGTTASSDGRFTTPRALSAAITSASTSGSTLMLTIACNHGASTQTCSGPISVSSHVTTERGSTVAVAATKSFKHKRKPKPPPKLTKVVSVGGGSYAVATGRQVTVKFTLSPAGQKLLSQFYKLPTTVTIGGTTALKRTAIFSYRVIHSPISFTWAFSRSSSVAQQLTVSGVPSGGMVMVICHGGGCPFAKRTFSPRRGRVALASAFKHSALRPGATLELEITAAKSVGKVASFTIRSGQQPSLAESCLPPGTRRPTRCVRAS